MDLARLKEPFEAEDIEWRVGQAGKHGDRIWARLLAYVTSRAIMNRLDEVCGPENWKNKFKPAPNDPKGESLLCGLSIRIGDEWVTKWDGADNTDVEPVKGGISDSVKRAGVQWGIGRYLYDIGESWATICDGEPPKSDKANWNRGSGKDKDKQTFYFWWKPPGLSIKFLPPEKKTPSDSVLRGDDGDWTQFTKPPREALESDEPHVWFMGATRELLRHAGAQTVGNARLVLKWLDPTDPIDVQTTREDPAAAKAAWERLMERSNTVPFTRMLHEAQKG